MIIKANSNDEVILNYGTACSNKVYSASAYDMCNITCDSSSITGTINSRIDGINKKPEVRVDQRSSLEVKGRQVMALYYKDGFRTNSKDLIPAIQSIDVFNENTIKMTFVNGDVQTATVQNGDPYFFEDGLLRCIVKEMIGKEGTAILSKLLSYATKVYNDAEAEKKKKAEEEEKKRIASEKNYEKAKKHWAKKRAAEREKRIQEMAEAIVRAEELSKKSKK